MTLAPGEAYETPILYAARSDAGLNGLSDRFHPFVRRRILGGRLAGKPRPVNFNTWEAVYFRHDLDELKALADLAAEVGAERFVLDDGWFEGRDDDTTSLGDWRADPAKYPDGLGPLIDHVRGLGAGVRALGRAGDGQRQLATCCARIRTGPCTSAAAPSRSAAASMCSTSPAPRWPRRSSPSSTRCWPRTRSAT